MKTKSLLFILLIAAAAVTINACKSKGGMGKELKEPFDGKKYYSDKNYFRAVGDAISENSGFSEEKAVLIAKQKLASNIESTIKSVTDRYVRDIEVGKRSNFEQSVENETREVVKLKMQDVVQIDKKKFIQKDGQYHCYAALEVSKDVIFNGVNDRISKNSRLQLEFDKERFRKIYDEEMKKLEDEQR